MRIVSALLLAFLILLPHDRGAGGMLPLASLTGSSTPRGAQPGTSRRAGHEVHNGQGPVEDGKTLYEAHCRGCHGAQGQGRFGTDLALVLVSVDPLRYARSSIEKGVPGTTMPAWGRRFGGPLSDGELDALASYGVELARQRRASPGSTSGRQPPPPLQDLRQDIAAVILLLALSAGGIALVAWTLRIRFVDAVNRRKR